jgi:hypothetical protein
VACVLDAIGDMQLHADLQVRGADRPPLACVQGCFFASSQHTKRRHVRK